MGGFSYQGRKAGSAADSVYEKGFWESISVNGGFINSCFACGYNSFLDGRERNSDRAAARRCAPLRRGCWHLHDTEEENRGGRRAVPTSAIRPRVWRSGAAFSGRVA